MTFLLDTHAWVWSLADSTRLGAGALRAVASGQPLVISAVTLYEIAGKTRLGKWPEAAGLGPDLIATAERQGVAILPLLPEFAQRAALFDWPHRDPFDRMIAATVQAAALTLISSDATLDSVPGGLHRVW